MARTFIRQDTQVRNSDEYLDNVAAGSTMESAPTNIQADLNNLRSQIKRLLWADVSDKWYQDVPTVNGKKRAVSSLNTDLNDIEEKRLLFRAQVIVASGVTVPATQNYVVLSVTGGEAPSESAAVGAVTTAGVVVAQATPTFGAHSLAEVAGVNAISPKSLCLVVDQATGDPLMSSGRTVYALIQSEIATDGHTFNDVDQRVQLSFVRRTSSGDDLEACPVADIESKAIDYSYVRRIALDNIPETAFLQGAFVDNAGAVDVTLDNAIDNQSGPATQIQDIDWRITDAYTLDFQTSDGLRNLLRIAPAGAGDEIEINVDTFDVNNALDADFLNGAIFDSGGAPISIGVAAGTINSATGADLTLLGTRELFFDDGNRAASDFSVPLKLTDTDVEWDALETAYGEVSLAAMLVAAKNPGNARGTKIYANVTVTTDPNTDVGGVSGGSNLDAQLPNMSTGTFTTAYDIYLNGELLRGGADSSANHDVYPGTSLANGQLRFEFKVKAGDVICVVPYNI